MNKFIIILVVVGFVIIGGVAWWFILPTRQAPLPAPTETAEPLFPTGGAVSPPASEATEPAPPAIPGQSLPVKQISKKAVAGMFVAGTTATSSVIYLERATGHVYVLPHDGSEAARLSQTTIPKIVTVVGGKTASSIKVLAQYLKDGRRQNFLANLRVASTTPGESFATNASESPVGELSGSLLDANIEQVVFSPVQDKIFHLANSSSGAVGTIFDPITKSQIIIFSSPLNEWLIGWPATSTIALLAKPSAETVGFLYLLDVKTKKSRLVVSGVNGLTTLVNKAGDKILLSGIANGQLAFGWYDLGRQAFSALPVKTLTDKCVWGRDSAAVYCGVPTTLPAGPYPDHWYSGETSFTDNLWKINILTGQAQIIFNPELSNLGEALDAYQLLLTNDETTLYFINKYDSTLWSLDLRPVF
ncbi:MAG: hypothetical protein HYT48_00360 [Candidatus Vogelbacteria bacterium]|nr:hypothetical protein [Candidatus Vogelbacteria bacterium]